MRKLFIFNILVLFLLLLSSFGCSSYPSDKYLVENFNNHEPIFEKLVAMIQEDSEVCKVNIDCEYIVIDNYQPNKVISNERYQEYKSLLKQIGAINVRQFFVNKNDKSYSNEIYFLVYENPDFMMGGVYKSYHHSKSKPDKLVDSLDELYSQNSEVFGYKEIRNNFYITLDIW